MNYENYKKYFDGGFFPVGSDHKLVNLENTGEYEVTATTGSGADVKTEKQYKPSCTGLTNMLRGYTGGSRFEALTQSQGHTFIPELADCTSYTGAKKAIIDHYRAANEPYLVQWAQFNSDVTAPCKITFSKECDYKIDWGNGDVTEGTGTEASYVFPYVKERIWAKVYVPHDVMVTLDVDIDSGNIVFQDYKSPVYRSFSNDDLVILACTKDSNNDLDAAKLVLNWNQGEDMSECGEIIFGNTFLPEVVNVNTGLAEWINLEEFAKAGTNITLNCRNLYWDWKELTFNTEISFVITIYPDPVTFKTCITYFATKATFANGIKPSVRILQGSGQDEMYEWAQQYADKFESIVKLQ